MIRFPLISSTIALSGVYPTNMSHDDTIDPYREHKPKRTPNRRYSMRHGLCYQIAHESGKPCRSVTGHIFYREASFTPILRLTHKPHVEAEIRKPFPRLTPRQAMRFAGRETRARAIAARFPAPQPA